MSKLQITDVATLDKQSTHKEQFNWDVVWTIEKFKGEDIQNQTPYEVEEIHGNLGMNAGIQLLLDLLIGAGGTAYNNANGYIGVGDSNTAAAAGQTDLQAATNKTRKGMEATYPQRSGQTISFRSVFGTSDANYAWEEWGIFNASTSGVMLNRKVESKGTKTSSDTWTLTCQITIS